MESSLKTIQTSITRAVVELSRVVDAVKNIAQRWKSIQTAFLDDPSHLSSFEKFPNLQSKLELEQLAICDSLIAGMNESLLLLEHAVTNARAALGKNKQTLKDKDMTAAWSFPPSREFLGDLFAETEKMIDDAAASAEKHRLALYTLHSVEESMNPESILKFVDSVA